MRFLSTLLLLAAPAPALAQLQPTGPIWEKGHASIQVTACPGNIDHDDFCRGIELRKDGRVQRLGAGYLTVKLLWASRRGSPGPDALVFGDDGGSGGDGDLFAVTLVPKLTVHKLSGERMDIATVRPGPGPLRLDLAFDIEFFNGASHAGVTIVPLPVRWAGGDYSADLEALKAPALTAREMDFRALAIGQELQRWKEDVYPADRLYPPEAIAHGTPVVVQALAESILAGHADQARQLLRRAWPRRSDRYDLAMEGEDAFWAALCRAIVNHPLWKRFDLGHLPHSDMLVPAN